MKTPQTQLCAMAFLAIATSAGCEETPLRGTPSHGPLPSTGIESKSAKASMRIVVDAGSPLAVSRVAKQLRLRLTAAGVTPEAAKIGGDIVNVDLRDSQVAAAEQALTGGRLDVYELDDHADPWTDDRQPGDGLTFKEEPVGKRNARFLVSAQSDALRRELNTVESDAIGLVGPYGPSAYRSFFARKERSIRGEYLAKANVDSSEAGAIAVLHFEGAATNMLRWASKNKVPLLVRLNDEVIAVVRPKEAITNGQLRFPLNKNQKQLASVTHGALSHAVTVSKPKKL